MVTRRIFSSDEQRVVSGASNLLNLNTSLTLIDHAPSAQSDNVDLRVAVNPNTQENIFTSSDQAALRNALQNLGLDLSQYQDNTQALYDAYFASGTHRLPGDLNQQLQQNNLLSRRVNSFMTYWRSAQFYATQVDTDHDGVLNQTERSAYAAANPRDVYAQDLSGNLRSFLLFVRYSNNDIHVRDLLETQRILIGDLNIAFERLFGTSYTSQTNTPNSCVNILRSPSAAENGEPCRSFAETHRIQNPTSNPWWSDLRVVGGLLIGAAAVFLLGRRSGRSSGFAEGLEQGGNAVVRDLANAGFVPSETNRGHLVRAVSEGQERRAAEAARTVLTGPQGQAAITAAEARGRNTAGTAIRNAWSQALQQHVNGGTDRLGISVEDARATQRWMDTFTRTDGRLISDGTTRVAPNPALDPTVALEPLGGRASNPQPNTSSAASATTPSAGRSRTNTRNGPRLNEAAAAPAQPTPAQRPAGVPPPLPGASTPNPTERSAAAPAAAPEIEELDLSDVRESAPPPAGGGNGPVH